MTLCYVVLREGETPFTKSKKISDKFVTWKIEQNEWSLHGVGNPIKASKFHKDLSFFTKGTYRERLIFSREGFSKYYKKHTGNELILREAVK